MLGSGDFSAVGYQRINNAPARASIGSISSRAMNTKRVT